MFASTYIGGPAENTRSYNTGPGNFFVTRTRTGGVDDPDNFQAAPAAPGTTLNNAFVGGPFSTIFGKTGLAKPTVAPQDGSPTATGAYLHHLESVSGPYSAGALNNNTRVFSIASKTAVNKVAGAAAAIAYDPFSLNPIGGGVYPYTPTLNGSLVLESDETGEVVWFDTDSYIYPFVDSDTNIDRWVENGQPLDQTLWTLLIAASGPIDSIGDLAISFVMNPQAIAEIDLSTTPGYDSGMTAAEKAALAESYAEAALLSGGIIVGGGTATLATDFQPFAPGTTFTPALGSSQLYAHGTEASITATPEPGSLALLLAPLALMHRRRSRGTLV